MHSGIMRNGVRECAEKLSGYIKIFADRFDNL